MLDDSIVEVWSPRHALLYHASALPLMHLSHDVCFDKVPERCKLIHVALPVKTLEEAHGTQQHEITLWRMGIKYQKYLTELTSFKKLKGYGSWRRGTGLWLYFRDHLNASDPSYC